MTIPEAFSTGVAHKIGRYSDGVRVPAGYEQIVTSGTPGLRPDGNAARRLRRGGQAGLAQRRRGARRRGRAADRYRQRPPVAD